ncbi:mitochondrial import translocase, subunit Tom22 [Athelia psychrophila]|uniref:Mitochondrial import translocase, subunit Tom22 n=1 Tax=Athelia psychrophila TaxID=1759441 RepID=A0A166W9G7_9AGAM|nr:mitochondrial import translocase, subunit Tom22 [Fibularhizoctonia sp. CBS 109695]
MVKVEIVEEKDHQDSGSSPYASTSSSRTSSSASLSSVSSELSHDETLYDRIAALVDIVPPTTRHTLSSRFSAATSFIKAGGKLAGNIVWIVTTSALLVGLPLALSLEDEAKIVAQEQEMMAQQQGAQQMLGGQGSMFPPPATEGQKGLVPPGF